MALQTTVRRSVARAFNGQLADVADPRTRVKSIANRVPLRAQVGTITVDTATDEATYTFTINGVELSLVAATSETTTTIATKIAALINAEPAVRGQVKATSAAAVVTLTGAYPGIVFTASDSDAKLTTVQASTTALEADGLRPGRWAVILGMLSVTSPDVDPEIESGAIAAAAYLTAQASSWDYATYEASLELVASVQFDGQTYTARHASATNADTSAAALRAKLGEALDGLPLTVGGADSAITITADAGAEFTAQVYFGTAQSTGVLTETTRSYPEPGTSLAFGGIVQRHLSAEDDADGLVYPGTATAPVVVEGKVWAKLWGGSNPSAGDPVFVYVGATAADRGKIYSATDTDRLQVPRAFARFTGRTDTSDGQTLVEIDVNAR